MEIVLAALRSVLRTVTPVNLSISGGSGLQSCVSATRAARLARLCPLGLGEPQSFRRPDH